MPVIQDRDALTLPPFVQQILGSLVRVAVVAVAGYLAGHSDIHLTEAQIGSVVTYLVPVVAVIGWSLYSKYIGRLKLLTALSSEVPMTEHEAESIVNDPATPNPSVLTAKNTLPSA